MKKPFTNMHRVGAHPVYLNLYHCHQQNLICYYTWYHLLLALHQTAFCLLSWLTKNTLNICCTTNSSSNCYSNLLTLVWAWSMIEYFFDVISHCHSQEEALLPFLAAWTMTCILNWCIYKILFATPNIKLNWYLVRHAHKAHERVCLVSEDHENRYWLIAL